jgi:murein DD-endopeptidase MepM/ murein hydrolase activator NlpD
MGRRISLGLALLLVSAAVSGCVRNGAPAPVEVHGHQRYERGTTMAHASRTEPGIAVVRAGDTLYSIARRNNTPMRAIIDANRLDPPYVLQPGQRLTLPSVRTHVVRAGDTMHGISRRYDVEMSSLVRANGIGAPYNIMVGQTLILPGEPAPAGPVVQTAAVTSASPAMVHEADPSLAPVAAPRGSIESAPLAPVASAPVTATREPPAAPPVPSAAPAASSPSDTGPVAVAPEAVRQVPAAPAARLEPPAETTNQAAAVEPAAASLPARAGRIFLWPVQGRVISDFGPKGSGMHNDGINIAAAKGTSIRAAENGVVVYAGNELRGFGNLLLLRHADGWMTAYAHADELLVARGEQVRRGQVIGRVGATGNVASPQVHFEIRRGSRAVNPREYLASSTASSG